MSAKKPLIIDFVNAGIASLTTPVMKETITQSFKNDSLFKEIRSQLRQMKALEHNSLENGNHVPDNVSQVLRVRLSKKIMLTLNLIPPEQELEHVNIDFDEEEFSINYAACSDDSRLALFLYIASV